MSHELRTPLNAIIGFSEIMDSGMFGALGSEKYQEYCHDILTSGHYLLEVINDILDMSKIEAGRMKLDMEPLDLSKTLAESLRVVSGRAEDKKLVLDADIEQTISVVADRRATKQIMVNLLSNAVKFTPEGGKIVVRSRMTSDRITLLIADYRHRHRRAFARTARPPLRAGREPAHQNLSRLGTRACHRAIPDPVAWRLDEAAFAARRRHRGPRLAAARSTRQQAGHLGGGLRRSRRYCAPCSRQTRASGRRAGLTSAGSAPPRARSAPGLQSAASAARAAE